MTQAAPLHLLKESKVFTCTQHRQVNECFGVFEHCRLFLVSLGLGAYLRFDISFWFFWFFDCSTVNTFFAHRSVM